MVTDNDSMEMRIIKQLVQHINNFVGKFVREGDAYCLILDEHALRKGFELLKYCQHIQCEVVHLSSDTTHSLQPRYRKVN